MTALRRLAFVAVPIALAACGISAVGSGPADGGLVPGDVPADGSGPPIDGASGGDGSSGLPDGGGGGDVISTEAGGDATSSMPTLQYVHSFTSLYTVNNVNGQTTLVGDFGGLCAGVNIGEIAIDRNGAAYVSTWPNTGFSQLHQLNLFTAACGPAIGSMGRLCNGLSFAPDPADPSKDALYAACGTSFYRVNPGTATTTLIGVFGTGLQSSGDIVWLPGQGMFITLNDPAVQDKLGLIDMATGAAAVIGIGVGRDAVYALGHRGGKLLGYGDDFVIEIDPMSGAGTTLNASTGFAAIGAASAK